MLVLNRKRGEAIVIGEGHSNRDVIVSVVDICGDRVRLGIVAPSDVPVNRTEVLEEMHRRNQTNKSLAKPDSSETG